MNKAIFSLLDFFLPQHCTGCDKKLTVYEPQVCDECFKDLLTAAPSRIDLEYDRKFKATGFILDIFTPFIFENEGTLQNIIHSLKYKGKFGVGVLLGKKLAESLNEKIGLWEIDLIVSVPLHHLRKAERGFNQSDFIVKGLSDSLKIASSTNVIKRIRFTHSQTKLKIKERKKNVRGAFRVNKRKKIINKNILIVDDVITTGSTINECARVLVKSGAAKVYACSVAIAE